MHHDGATLRSHNHTYVPKSIVLDCQRQVAWGTHQSTRRLMTLVSSLGNLFNGIHLQGRLFTYTGSGHLSSMSIQTQKSERYLGHIRGANGKCWNFLHLMIDDLVDVVSFCCEQTPVCNRRLFQTAIWEPATIPCRTKGPLPFLLANRIIVVRRYQFAIISMSATPVLVKAKQLLVMWTWCNTQNEGKYLQLQYSLHSCNKHPVIVSHSRNQSCGLSG